MDEEKQIGMAAERTAAAGRKRKLKARNPFYLLLLIAGGAFAITACAYAVMMVNQLNPQRSQVQTGSQASAQHVQVSGRPLNSGLLEFMDQHGDRLLIIELGVLAVCTFAAIGTEDFWTPRERPDAPRAGTVNSPPR